MRGKRVSLDVHIFTCFTRRVEWSFKEKSLEKVFHVVVADCFLQRCGAMQSQSLAGWFPSLLLGGFIWQQGAVSGFMCD